MDFLYTCGQIQSLSGDIIEEKMAVHLEKPSGYKDKCDYNDYKDKCDYNDYINYMEDVCGWRHRHEMITEKSTSVANTFSCGIGNTGAVIDIKCPIGGKMSIMGTRETPLGEDPRAAYPMSIKLCSSADYEICSGTVIRITKEQTCVNVTQIARLYYYDIGSINLFDGRTKDKDTWFRLKRSVEINGEEHLFFYVTGNTSFCMSSLPDVNIDSGHIKFSIDVDRWSS